jgi:hypothetical protein
LSHSEAMSRYELMQIGIPQIEMMPTRPALHSIAPRASSPSFICVCGKE